MGIEIFESPDGQTRVEVRIEKETIWITQRQMAELFDTTPQNITIHLRRIYQDGELDEVATCKDYLQVRFEGEREVKRTQLHYNFDAIISVGYRVNSLRGTQFRQWATQRLREYLVQGYAINESRLQQREMQVLHLKTGIQILSRAIEQKAEEEGNEWLMHYAKGLELLDDYDHENLDNEGRTKQAAVYPDRHEYEAVID